MKTEIYHCCEFNCKNSATVEIRFGNKPDDYTYFCDVHIEHLKPKDKEVFISNIHSGGANKIVDKAKEEQLTDIRVGQLNNKPELKLSDKIGHLNCDPEALKDPKFVEAINAMAELAYKNGKEMKALDSDLYEIADRTFKRLLSLKPTSLIGVAMINATLLEQKELKDITDEDAIEVAKIYKKSIKGTPFPKWFKVQDFINCGKAYAERKEITIEVFRYLESKGYKL